MLAKTQVYNNSMTHQENCNSDLRSNGKLRNASGLKRH